MEDLAGALPPCLVTPQLDADACCAAAWFQLPRSCLKQETIDRLRAIALNPILNKTVLLR